MTRETESPVVIRDYFDQQQKYYMTAKLMTRQLDLEVAKYLNQEVHGRILAVGGMWSFFEWSPQVREMTVLDLSEQMLKAYCPERAHAVTGDLYAVDFPPDRFDSIVFPMLLHHTAQGSWHETTRRVAEAIRLARSWLAPSGQLFIVEWCPHRFWYGLERAVLPLTRLFLKQIGQPLVIAHPRAFYERVLTKHFGEVESRWIAPADFRWWSWFPLFLNTPWLRLPFFLYPKMYLFRATARE
jgi:hypothetical protein